MRVENYPVTIQGLTFLVNGDWYPSTPDTWDSQGDQVTFDCDINGITVEGLPQADADSILTAMKINLKAVGQSVIFRNGYDMVELYMRENYEG